MPIDQSKFASIIQDAVAQKRVIKWGYLRQFGGLYPAQCDTVASHSSAVSVLAAVLGYEYAEEIEAATGVRLCLDDITLLAIFHDLGEGRSGAEERMVRDTTITMPRTLHKKLKKIADDEYPGQHRLGTPRGVN